MNTSDKQAKIEVEKMLEQNYQYGKEAMHWYGWASPVGVGIGIALLLVSTGLFIEFLHKATLI